MALLKRVSGPGQLIVDVHCLRRVVRTKNAYIKDYMLHKGAVPHFEVLERLRRPPKHCTPTTVYRRALCDKTRAYMYKLSLRHPSMSCLASNCDGTSKLGKKQMEDSLGFS